MFGLMLKRTHNRKVAQLNSVLTNKEALIKSLENNARALDRKREQAEEKVNDREKKLDTANKKLGESRTQVVKLEQQLKDYKSSSSREWHKLNDELKAHQADSKIKEQNIAKLERDLKKAQRNDTPKDPKTGKFVKKGKK